MRLAFSGKICSGKSTAAKYMSQILDCQVLSLAQPIKKIAREIFDMKTKDRRLLQIIGATGRALDEDIWVKKLLEEVTNDHCIVDDVRFKNEAGILRENGFLIIRLEVDEKVQRKRILNLYEDRANEHLSSVNNISETSLDSYDFDMKWKPLDLQDLLEKCKLFLKNRPQFGAVKHDSVTGYSTTRSQ